MHNSNSSDNIFLLNIYLTNNLAGALSTCEGKGYSEVSSVHMVPALMPVVTQVLWLTLLQEAKMRLGFLAVSGQRANNVYLNMSVKSCQ